MFKVQIKNKAFFLLLVVFSIFIGIVILHPFSHGLHHGGDDEHECPICLWLHSNTFFVSLIISLLIFFAFLCFCRLHLFIPSVCSSSITQSSRAPPF